MDCYARAAQVVGIGLTLSAAVAAASPADLRPQGLREDKLRITNQPPSLCIQPRIDFARQMFRIYVRGMEVNRYSQNDVLRMGSRQRNRLTRMETSQKRIMRTLAPKVVDHLVRALATELYWSREGVQRSERAPAWLKTVLADNDGSPYFDRTVGQILGRATWENMTVADFARMSEEVFQDSGAAVRLHGGSPWARVARTVLEYDTMPDRQWFDKVFFLEHNTGSVLSRFRGKGNDPRLLRELLDARSAANDPRQFMRDYFRIRKASGD